MRYGRQCTLTPCRRLAKCTQPVRGWLHYDCFPEVQAQRRPKGRFADSGLKYGEPGGACDGEEGEGRQGRG